MLKNEKLFQFINIYQHKRRSPTQIQLGLFVVVISFFYFGLMCIEILRAQLYIYYLNYKIIICSQICT